MLQELKYKTIKLKLPKALLLAVGLALGSFALGALSYTGDDNRGLKFPDWEPIGTVKYKNYDFTHIDYLQPQYINTIINEEMLEMVRADIEAGLITSANPSLGVNIGDGIKFTADNKIWLHISKNDETHRFGEIKNAN